MKITTEMIKAGYAVSKDVYHRKISRNDAIDKLVKEYGMNRGSASDTLVNFKKMINGERYIRTNNAEQTEYFFTRRIQL
jgi:5-methylcytosine-specific restriction enzyme A